MARLEPAMEAYIATTTDVPVPGREDGAGTVNCREARERRARAAQNFRRYDNLVYLVAGATAIALVASIALIVLQQSQNGIAGLVGSVVAGGATVWLMKLRNDERKNEKEAWEQVKTECRDELVQQDTAARLSLNLK